MRANSLVFAVIGLSLLAAAAYVLGQKVLFWYQAEVVTASVVGHRMESSDSENGYSTLVKHPVLAFTAPGGQVIEVLGPGGSAVPDYKVGEQVRLQFNPNKPNQVELPDFFSRWGALLLFAVLALMGTLTLWVVAVFDRSSRQ